MGKAELEALSKEELIQLILTLHDEIEALRLKFEKNKKPPTSSKNSSQPPTRDQKGNLPARRRRRWHGPPFEHEKHDRKFVTQPDHIIELRAKSCGKCHTDRCNQAGQLVDVNPVTELPQAPAQVIEVRQYAVACPECLAKQVEEPPSGLVMPSPTMDCRDSRRLCLSALRQIQYLSKNSSSITPDAFTCWCSYMVS